MISAVIPRGVAFTVSCFPIALFIWIRQLHGASVGGGVSYRRGPAVIRRQISLIAYQSARPSSSAVAVSEFQLFHPSIPVAVRAMARPSIPSDFLQNFPFSLLNYKKIYYLPRVQSILQNNLNFSSIILKYSAQYCSITFFSHFIHIEWWKWKKKKKKKMDVLIF